jgi:hypothetical protein
MTAEDHRLVRRCPHYRYPIVADSYSESWLAAAVSSQAISPIRNSYL